MIYRGLELSLSHITKETAELLEKVAGTNTLQATVARYEYGFFVVLPEDATEMSLNEMGFPPDLAKVMHYASTRKAEELKLDSLGEVLPNLPAYAWE